MFRFCQVSCIRFHAMTSWIIISLLISFLVRCDASVRAFTDVDVFLKQKSRPLYRSETRRKLTFGDYAEYPDTCPAYTTCPVICVERVADCPTKCDDGLTLCVDGTCKQSCDDAELESPCECDTKTFACAKVNDNLPSCKMKYELEYSLYAECIENQEEAVPQVSFTGPWFIACYCWIAGVTVLASLWCAYNQIINPVEESIQSLTPISVGTNTKSSEVWTQTGYRRNFVGSIILYLVWTTLWGIQFLLLLTTIFYYMQQEAITRWEPVIQDEIQSLLAFQLVWFVGIVWSFLFQWPESIESLFLRRCLLSQATHVAVVAPMKRVEVAANTKTSFWGDIFWRLMCSPADIFLRMLFSYNGAPPGFELIYCKVDTVDTSVPSFYCRMGRYVYNDEEQKFIPGALEVGKSIGDFLSCRSGLTSEQAVVNYQLVGPNIIPIDRPTIIGSLYKEFSKTFYVYQNFMAWSWFPYWSYPLALVQTFIRLAGGLTVATFQHISDSVLYKLSLVEGEVGVIRDGIVSFIPVKTVVPGDVMVLRTGVVLSDMVILNAEHIMVDESALTGESNPIAKIALDEAMSKELYDSNRHKVHTIFAGTEIIECGDSGEDLGLVLTTGSITTKGKLLSEVLSYQRHQFLFDDEIKIVLLIFVIQCIVLLTVVFSWLSEQFVYAWFYGIYIVGTVLPPLLPTVFVVSVGVSANRLQKRRITCTNSEAILIAGKVNVCCFDKTGTLTQTGMDFIGLETSKSEGIKEMTSLGMSVCHSLKVSSGGDLIGNHVDKACFEASGGVIDFKKGEAVKIKYSGHTYTILKQYDFDNHRQTQSVLVHDEGMRKYVFVKGSPEAISSICSKDSLPSTFSETLRSGAKSGIYQLAIAFKEIDFSSDLGSLSRDNVESSLTFCSFICFRNFLKPDTIGVMKELLEANVLVTMITGDNVLTGICIAREAGMVQNKTLILGRLGESNGVEWEDVDSNLLVDKPQSFDKSLDLAITGEAWSVLLQNDPEYAWKITKYVRVFGRCNPTDKVSVVTALVTQGYTTLMCGDGQNDCGALKSAHVGIALSSSDASIVAPFTSLDKDINSVINLLREGRCALSSALKAYSYYIVFGQVETYLQTINVHLYITFSEWCWIFLDGLWNPFMAFSLPLAQAAKKLYPCRPTASLLGSRTFYSIAGLLIINFFFVCMGLVALNQQDWYQCRKWSSEDVSSVTSIGDNFEASTMFIVGGHQYVATAVALNFGYKFRAAWYTNYLFIGFAFIFTLGHLIMTLYPSSYSCLFRVNCVNEDVVRSVTTGAPMPINNPYNTTLLPIEFRWILVGIMAANSISLCLWEYFFINTFLYKISKFGKDDPLESPYASGIFEQPKIEFDRKLDSDSSDQFENTKLEPL